MNDIIPPPGKIDCLIATQDPIRIESFLYRNVKNLQSYGVSKIIICDNSSVADNNVKIKNLARDYGAVYAYSNRRGKSNALNAGIKEATAEYLYFTDDDVIIYENNVIVLHKALEQNPNLGHVSGKVIASPDALKTPGGAEWEKSGALSKGDSEIYWPAQKKNLLGILPCPYHKIVAGANFMLRSNLLKAVGPFNNILEGHKGIQHGCCIEIAYRIVQAGWDIAYMPMSIVLHDHPSTLKAIQGKMFSYALGDMTYSLTIAVTKQDPRFLVSFFLYHPIRNLYKFWLNLTGQTKLSINLICYRCKGILFGFIYSPYHLFRHFVLTLDK